MLAESGLYGDPGVKVAAGALAAAVTLSSNAAPIVIPLRLEVSMQEFGRYRSYSLPFIDNTSAYSLSVLPFLFEIAPNLRMNMPLLLSQQSLLLEMRAEILKYFPNTPLSIMQKFDENGEFYALYIGIHTHLSVDKAINALDQLDDAYIVPNTERLEGIVVDVVF